jgi:hypothetical protein
MESFRDTSVKAKSIRTTIERGSILCPQIPLDLCPQTSLLTMLKLCIKAPIILAFLSFVATEKKSDLCPRSLAFLLSSISVHHKTWAVSHRCSWRTLSQYGAAYAEGGKARGVGRWGQPSVAARPTSGPRAGPPTCPRALNIAVLLQITPIHAGTNFLRPSLT